MLKPASGPVQKGVPVRTNMCPDVLHKVDGTLGYVLTLAGLCHPVEVLTCKNAVPGHQEGHHFLETISHCMIQG